MEIVTKRYELAFARLDQIRKEKVLREPFLSFFTDRAEFLVYVNGVFKQSAGKKLRQLDLSQLRENQSRLYREILAEHYPKCPGNPVYAKSLFGEEYGRLFCYLYAELRTVIPDAYEGDLFGLTIMAELLLEIYTEFVYHQEEGGLPEPERIKEIIYWFESDYSEIRMERRVADQLDPSRSFAAQIICEADLTDLRYLYWFGEYISDNEWGTAEFLNSLPQAEIDRMAEAFTEGYRVGFIKNNKDLSQKKTVNIRYVLGFERVIKRAVENFQAMGLKPVIYRAAAHSIHRNGTAKTGYYGGIPNQQYDFDHKEDQALYLDRALMNRKLEVLTGAYEQYKDLAGVHAGPAVLEVFGAKPFCPEHQKEALSYTPKQQEIAVEYTGAAGRLANQYIPGKERSFTIIAFPVPEIGAHYPEIFREIMTINTLDPAAYERMQQAIIDLLDRSEYVRVKGMKGNRTDLLISLKKLSNPACETKFENCTADVNIPVGEVFTSPVLKGTEGTLHVSSVYLNELQYLDLEFCFTDGFVTAYRCGNFKDEEAGKRLIKDEILHHRDTLPMGEFAIGTNTRAYVLAARYQIEGRLPILIAEKTGPHFALGDTCYSYSEDVRVCNSDGKEIIARDNEVSIQRRLAPEQAYFHCHTDITLPYDELGELYGVTAGGERLDIIREGRFVQPECRELNAPFDDC